MGNIILLRANLKKHKGALFGIFILTLLAAAALGTVMTIWSNSEKYIQSELERYGFGELTAWVADTPEISELADSIRLLDEIDRVETQSIIYTNYTANGVESDSEGQLITYVPSEDKYKFFTDDLSGYTEQPEFIEQGEVYVSPSMVTICGIKLGDEVTFPIARAGKNITLTVKGFYEDPVIGSSMIGMKGFLISESDRLSALEIIQNSGIDALARDGGVLHIFPKENSGLTASELNGILNEKTALADHTETVHSREVMAGFMLILQKAFSGIFLAFVIVLMLVVLIVLGHSISGTIASDFVNMGILKTIGFDSKELRFLQLLQYGIPAALGLIIGFIISVPFGSLLSGATLTTTGVLIPAAPSFSLMAAAFAVIMLLLAAFIFIGTYRIVKITPMKAIRGETDGTVVQITKPSAFGSCIHLRLALRQLISRKSRYMGAFAAALLLVFFAETVGRMNSWLGSDGKGMMDAFNPADHDIGVQSFGELTKEEFEKMILQYSDITDTYALAMPTAALNGISYTANVIDEPERFHILEGRTCAAENEVVITEFIAADCNIHIGDTVTVRGDSGSAEYIVSGIYSCANDMGNNFGMNREGHLKIGRDHPNLWCWHYFLEDASQKENITAALESAYGGDVHVHENTWPGLFGIISAMQALIVFMYVLVTVFILVVTVMTSSRLIAAEQKDMGIYKAIGFSSYDLRLTFALRFSAVSLLGGIAGIILSAAFTDTLVGSVMKLAGISSFSSSPAAFETVFPALTVAVLFTAFALLSAKRIKNVPVTVLTAE